MSGRHPIAISVPAAAALLAVMLGGCANQMGRMEPPFYQRAGLDSARSPRGATGQFEEAVAMASESRYSEAAEMFEGLARQFDAAGDRRHAAEATFWMAFCLEKQQRRMEAGTFYRRVIQLYADQPAAKWATLGLSRIHGASRRPLRVPDPPRR